MDRYLFDIFFKQHYNTCEVSQDFRTGCCLIFDADYNFVSSHKRIKKKERIMYSILDPKITRALTLHNLRHILTVAQIEF